MMDTDRIPGKFKKNPGKVAAILVGLVIFLLLIYYDRQSLGQKNRSPVQLIVYAFSTQEEVFTQGIFPAFIKIWESSTNSEILITGVFGPSGTLAGQINLGAPADIAIFSSENHLNYLKISRVLKGISNPFFWELLLL